MKVMEIDLKTIVMKPVIEEELVKSFNLMWGKFPAPIVLIHKSKTIISSNKQAKILSQGKLTYGLKCTSMPGDHKNCKANQALKEQKSMTSPFELNGVQNLSYWVPLNGEADYYLHFCLPNQLS